VKFVVEPMELEDIPQVLEVDRESYTVPWPASTYRREVMHNRNARYLVLRSIADGVLQHRENSDGEIKSRLPFPFFRWTARGNETKPGSVVGYAGMWLMLDEAHITTIALRREWRGKGLGELLLVSLVEIANEMNAERLTLEVRVSNEPAQNLYRKHGFRVEGLRPRYYSDNNEDAYIMTTASIRDNVFRSQFAELVRNLETRFSRDPDTEVSSPAFRNLSATEPGHGTA